MAKVTFSGKPAEKPFFGISRGALIPIRRKHGQSSGTSSQPKKEMSAEGKAALESFKLYRAEETEK